MIGHVLAAHNQIGGVLATGRRPSAGFVGAYDAIPNIVAAYGMRRLLTTYTGPILRMRRSSDNAEQDIGYEADGDLDTAAATAFIGAGSGYIRMWYEQSGNAYDAAQTTAANQPLYVASGQNGRPVGRYDGVNDGFIVSDAPPLRMTAISLLIVFSGNGTDVLIAKRDPSNYNFFANFNQWNSSVYTGPFVSNSGYVIGAFLQDSTFRPYKNGILLGTFANAIGPTSAASLFIAVRSIGGEELLGDISELIICNAALSDANRQAAETAANNYWAIY